MNDLGKSEALSSSWNFQRYDCSNKVGLSFLKLNDLYKKETKTNMSTGNDRRHAQSPNISISSENVTFRVGGGKNALS